MSNFCKTNLIKHSISFAVAFVLLAIPFCNIAFAEIYGITVPERYLSECPQQGNVSEYEIAPEREILVWTPYGYDYSKDEKYDICLLMHGDGGNRGDWLTRTKYYAGKQYQIKTLFDWFAYDNLGGKFIVVTMDAQVDKYNKTIINDIKQTLLFIESNYPTYLEIDENGEVIAGNDHVIIGGLSRGSMFSFEFMEENLDWANNYICLSGDIGPERIEKSVTNEQGEIRNLFVGIGQSDERFRWGCKESYRRLEPYAQRSQLIEYEYGHDWHTWISAIYDAMKFMYDVSPEEQTVRTFISDYIHITDNAIFEEMSRRIKNNNELE